MCSDQDQIETLMRQKLEKDEQIRTLEDQIEALVCEKSIAEQEFSDLLNEVNGLRHENGDLLEKHEEYRESLKEAIEERRREKKAAAMEIEDLKLQIGRFEAENKGYHDKIIQLKKEVDALNREKLVLLQKEKNYLDEKAHDSRLIEANNSSLAKEIETREMLENKIEQLVRKDLEAEEKIYEYQNQVDRITRLNQDFMAEKDEQILAMKAEIDELVHEKELADKTIAKQERSSFTRFRGWAKKLPRKIIGRPQKNENYENETT